MRKWNQGIYSPQHAEKYRGTLPIVYRSGLELKMMRWCDENVHVKQWGSESIIVPYLSPRDGKIHKYFTDFVLMLETPTGTKKYIVEVKPFSQTIPPSQKGRKNKNTLLMEQLRWAVDSSKWQSARQWAEQHGYLFMLVTEKDLK